MLHPSETTSIKRLLQFSLLISLAVVLTATASVFGRLTSQDIAALQEQGQAEGWTFTVNQNPATEYSLEELCGLKVPDNWQEKGRFDLCAPSQMLPDSFDWRDQDGCTPVKNQAGCGSCWAFGTVGPLECAIKIKDNITVDLSEQWLVSCNQDGWGCSGGWFAHGYHQYRPDPCGGTGAVLEADFPYVAYDASCNCPYAHHYLIESWAYVGNGSSIPSVDAMKQAIMDYGPISVAIYANTAMQVYGGGIFNGCASGTVNHAVVLVGWDDNQGASGVWFARNSWGTGWGEAGGYMRIEYGCSSIGYGACYINYPGAYKIAFEYPNGIPFTVISDQTNSFDVVVTPVAGTPVSGSGQLHYAINGGAVQITSMTEGAPNHYEATLPPVSCGDRLEFYVSAEAVSGGRYYDPHPDTPNVAIPVTATAVIFQDNFETDKGWTVSGDATDGQWDRGLPVGGGDRGDPATDFDGSGSCFLTDNVDGDSDVDGGTTTLVSPPFNASTGDAIINYARWYSNDYGSAPNSDEMHVYVSDDDGATWTLVETVGPEDQASGGWLEHDFVVSDFVTPTNQVRIRFDASDLGTGSVVEAAIDAVKVTLLECGSGPTDSDSDGIPNETDNCPYTANSGQEDGDEDGVGDACDNCPDDQNADQADTDNDLIGNTCDNCPDNSNYDQTDVDDDGIGDICDNCPNDPYNDIDNDSVCGDIDNCPTTANPGQADADGDGFGDLCDQCTDTDADGYGDPGYPVNTCDDDNCPNDHNPDQADADSNGIGDACCCLGTTGNVSCDSDDVVDIEDLTCLIDYLFVSFTPLCCPNEANIDGDVEGVVDVSDLTDLIDYLFVSFTPTATCP